MDAPLNIKDANDLVLRAIGRADSTMILGFLPLSQAEEDSVLRTVKEKLRQSFHPSLVGLLRVAPAAVAYALAVAPARTCQGGREFWSCYNADLGITIQPLDRPQVTNAFRKACREVGLLDGTIDETAHKHVAPFLFQAGILHRWTGHLAQGVRLALQECPAPEGDDWPALKRFAVRVKHKVPIAQCNLRGLLDTAVGPLLVRRLVSAYSTRDWDVLPTHLKESIRDAFAESGRGAILKSPHLFFQEAFGRIQLVLPAQSNRLASAETFWRIDGRRYSGRAETTIPVTELSAAKVEIELCDLSGGFSNQHFEVDSRIDQETPFRIFRTDNGRERKSDAGRSAELPPGNYTVLMLEDVVSNDEDYVQALDGLRSIDIELRPGDDALILSRGGMNWSIRPQLKQGIYVDRSRCFAAPLEDDGEFLHYGEELGLVAYFPADSITDSVFRITINCSVIGPLYIGKIEAHAPGKSVYIFQDNLRTAVSNALFNLSPGIHRLDISLSHTSGRVDHSLWYWKGLERVSESDGFKCSSQPTNINPRACRGVRVEGKGLSFVPGYHAPTVLLGITSPEAVLRLSRAGVHVTVKEPGSEWDEEPSVREPLVVTPKDRRLLRFRSGGFQRWEIIGNERTIANLNQNRASAVLSLSGIASELGGSGRIVARGENGKTIPLLSFTQPLMATNPAFKQDHGKGEESWTFKVPTEELHSLGVAVRNLTEQPNLSGQEIAPLVHYNGEEFEVSTLQHRDGQIVISAKCEGNRQKVKVKASFRVNELNDEWWALDFFRRTAPDGEWIPLECAEPHGYSKVRLFAWGSVFPPDDAGWWRRLKRAGRPTEGIPEETMLATALSEMSAGELDQGLAACRSLLGWKYPSGVWKVNAHRLQDFPVHLGQHRFGTWDDSAGLWWKHAAIELDEYASISSVPITRQFLFGSQPASLRTPRECLSDSIGLRTAVGRSLDVPFRISTAGSLKDYLIQGWEHGEISEEIIPCYANFMAVHTGKEAEFRQFSLNQFLTGGVAGVVGLEERTTQLHEQYPRFEIEALLSPEHLLFSIRALNRRCRVVDQASQGDVEHPLARVAQTIEKVSQRLDPLAPHIAQLLGWNSQRSFIWTPPLLENRWSEKIAELTWVVAATSRLSAHEKLSKSAFDQKLIDIFCSRQPSKRKIQNRLCIVLSLAPELFSFYVALFELLFPINSSN
ncbi:MAG: hypothetical protein KDN22_16895 [Verrucomicrobiae bacterium]|nr:hypothetical protein [Verrucomicrobiae bacterium]